MRFAGLSTLGRHGPNPATWSTLARCGRRAPRWPGAGDDETALAEAQAGLAASREHADPWQVGHLRRWVHLAGGTVEITSRDSLTPFELETNGDWRSAAEAWTGRGCPYDAALAQLGGDISAVKSALATFRRLGAKATARRAQQRPAALRERVPRTRRGRQTV
jgi:hypothetical protein